MGCGVSTPEQTGLGTTPYYQPGYYQVPGPTYGPQAMRNNVNFAPAPVIDKDRWTKGIRKRRVVEGPAWMPDVPDDVTESWQTTCRMCSMHNDEKVFPETQVTVEGMLTYTVIGSNGQTGHVIHKPTLFWEKESFRELDSYAKKAPRTLNGDFRVLVSHLMMPTRTTLEKVRVLFSWIAAQDVHRMTFTMQPPEGSPDWFLEKIKMRRTDAYRYLFSYLCRYAGVQCEFIKGHCKGARCFPGTRYVGEAPSTTWTGVCVDGQWGIVDTHWGSYSVIDDDDDKPLEELQSQISMDEFYFFPNPRYYLSSHCPEHPNWQLIENPVHLETFEAHVKCTSAFFALQLYLLSHHNGLVHTTNGKVDIYIGLPPQATVSKDLAFTYNLKTKEERSRWRGIKLDRFVSQQRMKGAVVFTICPPEKGKFLFEPFVGLGNSTDSFRVCEYMIICDQAKDISDNAPLPDYKGSWGPGKEVVSKGLTPVTHISPYVQCEDGMAEVLFTMDEDVQLTARLFEDTVNDRHLQRFVAHEIIDGAVKFHVVSPKEGNHGLAIYAKEEGEDILLCNYITQAAPNQTSAIPFPTVTNGLYGPVVPAFSEMGLSSKTHRSAFIECDTGELDLRLSADRVLLYEHDLFWETLEEKVNLHGNVFKQILDGEVQFWLRLPHLGKYRFTVYAKEPAQQGEMAHVINYCINCTGTRDGLGPFPVVHGKQWGRKLPALHDLSLTPASHPTAYIEASGTLEIVFNSTERLEYTNHLKLWKMGKQQRDVGDFACHKILDDGKTMVLMVKFPQAGEYSLELYVRDGKDQNVLNYLIECDQPAEPCEPFPEVWGRRWGPVYPWVDQLGITLVSHTDPVIDVSTGQITLVFGTTAPLWFYPELSHYEDDKTTDLTCNAIIQDDPQNSQQILATLFLLNAGYYKFSLFAKVAGANGNHQRAVSYLIHCTEATEVSTEDSAGHTGFPQIMGCWGTGCRILGPNARVLPGGDSQHFKLRVPDAAGVAVILPNKKWCHLQQEEDGTWEGDVVVPLGGYRGEVIKVVAKMKEGGDSYLPTLQYIVGEDSQEAILAEEEAARKREDEEAQESANLLLTTLGLSMGSHPDTAIETKTGELDIRLGVERSLKVSHQLVREEEDEKIDMSKYVFQETMDGEVRFWLRLPSAGEYTLFVNAAEIKSEKKKTAWQDEDEDEDESSASQNVINYNITCTETAEGVMPFPSVEGGQWGPVYPQALSLGVATKNQPSAYIEATGEHEIVLESPSQVEYTYRLRMTGEDSDVVLDDYACHKVLEGGNKTAVMLRLPKSGDYTLEVAAKGDGSDTHENVANYFIHCTEAAVTCEPFPSVANRCWGIARHAFTDEALRPQSHDDPFIKAEDGNLKISFNKSKTTSIYSSLIRCSEGHKCDASSYSFVQETSDDGETFEVDMRLQEAGYYKLTLWTKNSDEDNRDVVLANYLILCKHGLEDSAPFPERSDGWEQGYQLHEPLVRNLKAKETVAFRGRFPGAAEVAVTLPTSEWVQLDKRQDETWEGTVTMPGNKYSGDVVTLNILPDHEEGDYTEILRYTMEEGEEDVQEVTDQGQNRAPDEDEDMGQEEEYQLVIRENRKTFEDNMNPVKVIPKFEEEKFIDEEEAQELTLQLPNNANEVNKALLNVVSREGEEAFVVLRDVLKDTQQTELVDIIQDVKIEAIPDNTAEVTKKKVVEATKAKNKSRIERALAEYNEQGLSQSDDVYKEAERTLRLLNAREGLRKAIDSRQKDQLKEAMKECSEFKDELRKDLQMATEVLDAIKRLESLRHNIMAMNAATIAELKTYNQPPPAVNQVMMATFLLLGNSKAQIKDWPLLQTLMGKTGRQSLKRRIKKCQPSKLSPDTVEEAKRLLQDSGLSLDAVRDVSAGAATFYVWSMGMIEEVEQLTKPKESAIKQLTRR